MYRILLALTFTFAFFQQSTSQVDNQYFTGVWEDAASDNDNSLQFIVRDSQYFIFASVPQANLTDSVPVTRDKLYKYKWVSENIISYGKLPNTDPMKAKMMPPVYTFMRIDKLEENVLHVSLCDKDYSKSQLDSMIEFGNPGKQIGERIMQYRKLDLKKEMNKALLMGLWDAPESNDSVKFHFYVQKNKFGFLKIKKEDFKAPTALKPNKGYHYRWINGNIFYYYKEAATGFTKKEENPNKYSLMRIEEVDRKKLTLTMSTRPFNKSGLKFIMEDDDFDQYFANDKLSYKRGKVVKEKCEGTEFVRIGSRDVMVKKKPIIYLYPEEETSVNVKVSFSGELTHTYPKYNPAEGWTVEASPDGTLRDPENGREYYALYWEGENDLPYTTDKGFMVKGEEVAGFLEEKCEQLGLSAREANEFIIYWLPQLESNAYNFIHFSMKEYQAQAALEITPKPDALVRVFMLFKGLDEPFEVEEQDLGLRPTRKGFTVVEWGGASMEKSYRKIK